MKKVKLRDKIVQRCIGFCVRQMEFFEAYPDFKPDTFCRMAIDNQIREIDDKYLEEDK